MTTFRTEIEWDELYRDPITGFEGAPSAIYFHKHGCERVALKSSKLQDGKIVELVFDAPELQRVKDSKNVELIERRTGGPHDRTPVPR